MSDAPLVTVVIPTWNRARLVLEAVASVAAQTYPHWELVVADDGSTDDTRARLLALAEPRLRVVSLEHGGSSSVVRNRGAAAAKGSLLAFLDSDDLWLPRKLELQVAARAASGARWCYADYARVDAAGAPVSGGSHAFTAQNGRIVPQLLTEETSAFIGTWLVERSLFEELGGFDEGLRYRGDLDLALRLAAAADAVAVPEVVTLVREHPGRITLAVEDPHERSALVFERFVKRDSDESLRRIAHRRWVGLTVDGAFHHLSHGRIARGLRLMARAARSGGAGAIGRRLPRTSLAALRRALGR